MPMASVMSGLMRMRTWLGAGLCAEYTDGVRFSRTSTSVQVTGRFLPARM